MTAASPVVPGTARPRTAYVLAGGGSLGAVQVGMLKALAAAGLRPDFIVGASAGAINGAYAAARPDPEGIRELERLWTTTRRHDIFRFNVRTVTRLLMKRDSWKPPPYKRSSRRTCPIAVSRTRRSRSTS